MSETALMPPIADSEPANATLIIVPARGHLLKPKAEDLEIAI
jgi:hypothetical protein